MIPSGIRVRSTAGPIMPFVLPDAEPRAASGPGVTGLEIGERKFVLRWEVPSAQGGALWLSLRKKVSLGDRLEL